MPSRSFDFFLKIFINNFSFMEHSVTQLSIYKSTASPIIEAVLDGFNGMY